MSSRRSTRGFLGTVAIRVGGGICDSLNLALPSLAGLGSTAPRLRLPRCAILLRLQPGPHIPVRAFAGLLESTGLTVPAHPWHASRRRRSLQIPPPALTSCRTRRVPFVAPTSAVGRWWVIGRCGFSLRRRGSLGLCRSATVGARHQPSLNRPRRVRCQSPNIRWVSFAVNKAMVADKSAKRGKDGSHQNRNATSSKSLRRATAARRASWVRSGPWMAGATNPRSEVSHGWRTEVKRDGPPSRVAPFPAGSVL